MKKLIKLLLPKINSQGFTLIELLLYVAIIGIILLTVSGFLYTTLRSRVKNEVISEVNQQGIQLTQLMTQTIRNSSAINSPASGSSSASLSLNTSVPANNPTIFDLSSGAARIKQASAAEIPLTNSRVVVSGLSFTHLTSSSIKIQFTLTHVNPGNRPEYTFSQTFNTTASLRP